MVYIDRRLLRLAFLAGAVYDLASLGKGGTVGWFDWLFGDGDDPAKRTVEGGQACSKCGEPVPRDNMAFDSGSGRPIHRRCPDPGDPEVT